MNDFTLVRISENNLRMVFSKMKSGDEGAASDQDIAAFFVKGSMIYTKWSASSSVWMALNETRLFASPKDKILRSLIY